MSYPNGGSARGSATIDELLNMLSRNEFTHSSEVGSAYDDLSELSTSVFSSAGSPAAGYLSQMESAILRSKMPIEIQETEEITVIGQRGIWANRDEEAQWEGEVALSEYAINEDQSPEIITKKSQMKLEYVQELAIRYLRPPTPAAPGDIIVTQEADERTAPAPPLIIRQQPPRAETPPPLVIREAPPPAPPHVGIKRITISGRRLPPPPRKVIIERLAPLPNKPQNVIIERWLPYPQVKRRVIFNRSSVPDPIMAKPKNVIIQWEAPAVSVRKEIKYLGVIRANPAEYVSKFGASLKKPGQLPDFVLSIRTPDEIGVLAADYQYSNVYELEGNLDALKYVDLDREGLSEYKSQLSILGIFNGNNGSMSYLSGISEQSSEYTSTTFNSASASTFVQQVLSQLEVDEMGTMSVDEAHSIFLRINSRLGRTYSQTDINSFFYSLKKDRGGRISLNDFKRAFEEL